MTLHTPDNTANNCFNQLQYFGLIPRWLVKAESTVYMYVGFDAMAKYVCKVKANKVRSLFGKFFHLESIHTVD